MMNGTLYIVSTPIGNLEDITLRALRVLKEADLIAAEDTRVTMKLLQVNDIHTPLTSCHQHNEETKGAWLAEKMLDESIDVALTTDAGTPCVSDPGYGLVKACVERGIEVLLLDIDNTLAPYEQAEPDEACTKWQSRPE